MSGCDSQRFLPGDDGVLTCIHDRCHPGPHRDPSGQEWHTGEIFPGFAEFAAQVKAANRDDDPVDDTPGPEQMSLDEVPRAET